jgi:Concanavalin A-like lectin/glucanases superfamily
VGKKVAIPLRYFKPTVFLRINIKRIPMKISNLNNAICFLAIFPFWTSCVHAAPTGLVGNWHMDREKGQSLIDSSPYVVNGTLGTNASANVDDPTWSLRRFDTAALKFNGSENDYVRVPRGTSTHLEPSKITVEAWIKPEKPADPTILPYIVAKGLSDKNNYCAFASYAVYLVENRPVFYISDGENYYESPYGPIVTDGKWHHVVGTYDRAALRLYVDGVEIGAGTPQTQPIYYNYPYKDLIIGDADGTTGPCKDYNSTYSGDIDEVRIWNRALTTSEVALRYKGD